MVGESFDGVDVIITGWGSSLSGRATFLTSLFKYELNYNDPVTLRFSE
jgi:hypothetical protein